MILFSRKKNKIVSNKIPTIIFGAEIRVGRINIETILNKIMITGAHARNTFIQDSISKLISTSGINS